MGGIHKQNKATMMYNREILSGLQELHVGPKIFGFIHPIFPKIKFKLIYLLPKPEILNKGEYPKCVIANQLHSILVSL